MIRLSDYNDLLTKTYNLKCPEFDSLTPGQFYILIDFKRPLNSNKNYIKLIHVIKNSTGCKIETIDGYKQSSSIPKNPGIWYSTYNLDLYRNKLSPVSIKKDSLSFFHQLDYERYWTLNNIPNKINKLD